MTAPANPFTQGPLGPIFAKTALPIILVMSTHGLLTVVDAMFLGLYVGADALGAVTLMFPLYMLIVALSTLVSNGMSSELARKLGAEDQDGARAVYAGAHGLAFVISAGLILGYISIGTPLTLYLSAGSEDLAEMGRIYLGIMVFMSPIGFVLGVNSDALRNEGRVGLMAAMSITVSISNIGFNYVLIVVMGWGVAGSAYGSALAQLLALGIILAIRLRSRTQLRPQALWRHSLRGYWQHIIALGAPQSINFIGIALGSAAIISTLQLVDTPIYETTVSAYGVITRLLTFFFLPLLGLSHAVQSIVGNNYGAEAWARSDTSLRIGMATALIYCCVGQFILSVFPRSVAGLFITDPAVIAEISRILPVAVAMVWMAGPLVIIAAYFQAIGDARRAAILSLSKQFVFAIPLTFAMPLLIGEWGIWLAGPASDILAGGLNILVLLWVARRLHRPYGLFLAQG